jgi:hypothetical protein
VALPSPIRRKSANEPQRAVPGLRIIFKLVIENGRLNKVGSRGILFRRRWHQTRLLDRPVRINAKRSAGPSDGFPARARVPECAFHVVAVIVSHRIRLHCQDRTSDNCQRAVIGGDPAAAQLVTLIIPVRV